jgi:carboxypeptidase family protein
MSSMPRLPRILQLVAALALGGAVCLAAEPIRVTGRVAGWTDIGQARPLSGARVELFPAWEDYASAVKRLTEKNRPAPLARALTDAEGSFDIAVPEAGAYRLAVQAEGYLSEEISLLPVVEDLEVVTTALLPARPVEARTFGADGRPLAGVAVRLSARERQGSWGPPARPTTWRLADQFGVSDREGRLQFLGHPNFPGVLTAVSLEYLGQSVAASPGQAGLELRLDPRQAVWVEAQDPAGKPVPGALLRWQGQAAAVAGPDGRAKLCLPANEPLSWEGREGWQGRIVPPANRGIETLKIPLLPPRSLVGKVLDSRSGKPISASLVWNGWPLLGPPVQTDAEGAFRMDVLTGSKPELSSAAAGFFPGELQAARPDSAEPILLKLDPAATLAGIVVDAAGQPLAAVRISADPPRSRPGEPPERATARSRSDGGFLLTGLRPDGSYELTAARSGFGRSKTTARTAAAGKKSPRVRIVMGSGQTASGQVLDDDGQPVSGVGVELEMAGSMDSPPATAESDAEGRFELRHLDAGTATLVLKAEGYAPLVRPQIEIPEAQPATDLGTFTISRAVGIEGRVTDRRGGPIEGATVRVLPAPEDFAMARFFQPSEESRTGPEGKFRVQGLRRGSRYNLRVEHPAYVATTAPGVQPPMEEPIRIEMEEAHSLAGRVTGPQGEPVAHAALSRVEEMRHGSGMSRSSSMLGETDSDGRFRVTGLPSGLLLVEVKAETYASRRETLQMPENGDLERVEIVLQRGLFLDVRVLDSKGRAQRGFFVRAEPQKPSQRENPFLSGEMGPPVTDSEGRIRLPLRWPGVYRVVASRMMTSVSESVTAVAGNTPVELRLPPGFEISGRVVGPDGEGVSGAFIQAETADGGRPSTRVEADGTFVLSDLPDGEYRLKAEDRQGKASAPRDVRIAGASVTGLELTLDRESGRATLTGHILGLPAEELPRVRVTAYPVATAGRYGVSSRGVGADGAYKIEGLEPGEWRVEAMLLRGGRTEAKAQIEPGATAVLDLEFPKRSILSGRVLLDGAALAGAEITSTRSGSFMGGATTAWDGTFTLQYAEPGPLTLSLMRQDGIGTSRTVQVTEDKTLLIELSSGRLRGTAVSSTGEPVEGAEIDIEGQFDGGRSSFSIPPLRSEPDGTFESSRLVAGKYQVKILKEGFAPAQATVEVPPGGEGTVALRLTPKGGS